MAYWLVKTEPTDGGLLAFQAAGPASLVWDGVRNYQARNFLRAMDWRDEVLLYHASCAEIGVVAQLKVARKPYPDPLQFDPKSPYFDASSNQGQPRWTAVDLALVRAFPKVVPLTMLKRTPAFEGSPLTRKGSRLSVLPINKDQWRAVMALAGV
ncbi:EVE domain-containing protein [Pseudomonadales bacterium]|nr:EVE domain-containing protein [Pseudomonadales bacterium]MDC3342607.1 EVE domain-containing protein [Pseudomonadales bacterium]